MSEAVVRKEKELQITKIKQFRGFTEVFTNSILTTFVSERVFFFKKTAVVKTKISMESAEGLTSLFKCVRYLLLLLLFRKQRYGKQNKSRCREVRFRFEFIVGKHMQQMMGKKHLSIQFGSVPGNRKWWIVL